jgi:hypothetical protein
LSFLFLRLSFRLEGPLNPLFLLVKAPGRLLHIETPLVDALHNAFLSFLCIAFLRPTNHCSASSQLPTFSTLPFPFHHYSIDQTVVSLAFQEFGGNHSSLSPSPTGVATLNVCVITLERSQTDGTIQEVTNCHPVSAAPSVTTSTSTSSTRGYSVTFACGSWC